MTLILTITLLTGCSTRENPHNGKNTLEEIFSSSYTAKCIAKVTSNKTENEYTYSCERFEDGSCSVDYGDLVVHINADTAELTMDGSTWHTGVAKGEAALVPSYFFNEYLKGGSMTEQEDGYMLKCEISGDNPYRCTAEMELDKKLIPEKMCIKDKDGKVMVEVAIMDFSY